MYRRTRDITPYWLFVKDISHTFSISTIESHAIASVIWSTSDQREEYKQEAKKRKLKLKLSGPYKITPAGKLNNYTVELVKELL